MGSPITPSPIKPTTGLDGSGMYCRVNAEVEEKVDVEGVADMVMDRACLKVETEWIEGGEGCHRREWCRHFTLMSGVRSVRHLDRKPLVCAPIRVVEDMQEFEKKVIPVVGFGGCGTMC